MAAAVVVVVVVEAVVVVSEYLSKSVLKYLLKNESLCKRSGCCERSASVGREEARTSWA